MCSRLEKDYRRIFLFVCAYTPLEIRKRKLKTVKIRPRKKVATLFAPRAYLRHPQIVGRLVINHLSGRLQPCVPMCDGALLLNLILGIFTCFCIAINLTSLTPSVFILNLKFFRVQSYIPSVFILNLKFFRVQSYIFYLAI